jgi:hypothetical protein
MTGTHLEAVAEAIADNLAAQAEVADGPDRYADWIDPDELAAAAVDALQLTEEIGYALPGEVAEYGQPDAWFSACDIRDAPDIAEKLNDGRQLFRRLVGPWVVQPEAVSDE